jgi:threonine dehydrogenase-like Zn-dependent dehydrogenase
LKTAVFYGGADIRVEEIQKPPLTSGQVRIAVHAAGICGSDLHRYRGHDPWGTGGIAARGEPRRAGHEFSGVIAEIGPGVEGLTVGQAVAVEPMQLAGCGHCHACHRGDTNLCQQRGMFDGRRWTSAGFSEFDVARADHVFAVPDGLGLDVAALADVYACAIHAIHRVPVGLGDTVLVLGTGPVGLALGHMARCAGARRTILAGRRREPLEAALAMGAADQVVVAGAGTNLAREVRTLNGGGGVEIVYEAIGGTDSAPLRTGIDALLGGGALCILGAYLGDVALPYREANDKEVTVCWSNGYASWKGQREFQAALDWLDTNRSAAAQILTHRFPLAEIAEAFRVADQKQRTGAIKVLVEP